MKSINCSLNYPTINEYTRDGCQDWYVRNHSVSTKEISVIV